MIGFFPGSYVKVLEVIIMKYNIYKHIYPWLYIYIYIYMIKINLLHIIIHYNSSNI